MAGSSRCADGFGEVRIAGANHTHPVATQLQVLQTRALGDRTGKLLAPHINLRLSLRRRWRLAGGRRCGVREDV